MHERHRSHDAQHRHEAQGEHRFAEAGAAELQQQVIQRRLRVEAAQQISDALPAGPHRKRLVTPQAARSEHRHGERERDETKQRRGEATERHRFR
jgi:hypothetical protein